MSLLDRYGIKEVADVTFYELNDTNPGVPGAPVLYLDTLKVSTVEQTAENTEARGGKGNTSLMAWDYGKEIILNIEDALFSTKSLEIMYGGTNNPQAENIIKHKYYIVKNINEPFFIWNEQEENYIFNEDKALAFGLPWKRSGHSVVSNGGSTSTTLYPIGEATATSYGGKTARVAKTILPTYIPSYIAEEDYTYELNTQTGPAGEIYNYTSNLISSGVSNITLSGSIAPYSNVLNFELGFEGATSIKVVSFEENGESNPQRIQSIGIDGKQVKMSTALNASTSYLPYEMEIEVEFNSSYYLECLEATVWADNETTEWSRDYGYSYVVGEGMLGIRDLNKEFYGDSYLVLDNHKISLSKPVSEEELLSAGFEIPAQGAPLYLASGAHLFEILVDNMANGINKQNTIDISANSFPGTYYVTGDTFIRNEKTGKDEFFQLILPKVKVLSESNTITMEAEGEPTVFNMSLKVLKSKETPIMSLIQYAPLAGDSFTFAHSWQGEEWAREIEFEIDTQLSVASYPNLSVLAVYRSQGISEQLNEMKYKGAYVECELIDYDGIWKIHYREDCGKDGADEDGKRNYKIIVNN